MNNIKDYIGKQFKCTDLDFEGLIGTITDAWYEEFIGDIEFLRVEGEDWGGVFCFNEGDLV